MTRRVLSLLLLATFSASCAVGPDYKRPKVPTPETYRGQKEAAATETPFGDLPWWDVFQDETLRGLIQAALEQNKDLRIAAARVQEARGLYRATRGEQFPEISFQTDVTKSWTSNARARAPVAVATGNATSVQVGVDLSYQADLWGQFRRATEAARADLFSQEEFRKNVLITLIGDVARAYFELRELDEELAITRRTVGTRRKSLNLVRQRLQGGVVSLLDVRQSEAELAVAAADIPELERQIGLKENEISLLLGQNPGEVPRNGKGKRAGFPPKIPVDLPSSLLERRPDIRGAEQQLIAANARIGEAKALFFPQLNLSGFAGLVSVGGPLGVTAAAASAAGSLFQFIFDGGKRKGNYDAAKARFEQALIRYEQVIQQSFREVSDALISLNKLKGVRKELQAQVFAAGDGHRLAGARYEGGVSSYLEVLEAERQLFGSELALAQVKRNQLIAVVQLYRALGGGWSTDSLKPESRPAAESLPASAANQ